MVRSSPRASAGLRMLAASIAPDDLPAPTRVCISSMKSRISPSEAVTSCTTAFSRSSNSPWYLAPAISAPMSSEKICFDRRFSGTSPFTMRWAIPSAMAVLPTPASPTRMGLFLVRRERICSTRRISSSRPITGSSFPERAIALRSTAYLPSASNCCSEVCESTVAPLRKTRMASSSSFSAAPERFSSSDAALRSATRPSSRCSVEAYLSLNFRVKSTARCMVRVHSCEKKGSPAPSTRGSAATARFASSRSRRTFTPVRPSRNAASESSSRTRTASRCSGSTACCPCSPASDTAPCSASCALIVRLLMFMIPVFCLFPFRSSDPAKRLPRRSVASS